MRLIHLLRRVKHRFFEPLFLHHQRRQAVRRAARWLQSSQLKQIPLPIDNDAPRNALRAFFDDRKEGPGIWKWIHYFDIYERHLAKFQNTDANIMEIGVYSGGSLDMWQSYFGKGCHIYGVDLMPECKAYEREGVTVFIGDQADRNFWHTVKQTVPRLDVVIDDGGHLPHQQMVTLEELLPHLQPGGVYICEDVHGDKNAFARYSSRIAQELNAFAHVREDPERKDRRITCKSTVLQSVIASVHFYPFVIVIEKNPAPVDELACPKHGTQWQPFLS